MAKHMLPLLAAALCVLAAALADPGDAKVRPILPGSIATLQAATRSAATRDNQTMTAVIDARRAMLAAANESRANRPVEDAVGQGDGDGDGEAEEQQPTATADAATGSGGEEDQGDEHRPQNHRVVDPTAGGATGHGEGQFAPSTELGPIQDQYGYDSPTRHIHIHQHHLGGGARGAAGGGAGASSAGSAYTAPSGTGGARRPNASPVRSPGLSHYRASSLPGASAASSGPSAPSAPGHHQHVLLSYKPVKFESEEQQQQQYSVHEDQDHHHYHNQQAVHSAIAAAHPVSQGAAGEATGELAVGIGLGAGLSEGLGVGGLGGGGAHGGGEAGLSYPLLGSAPYDPPKALLQHAAEPLTFSHRPKEVKKGKSGNLWKSALRVMAGLAPLALLVAAISPNVLIIDPRLGTRQRSSEGQGQGLPAQRCEQRAVCEVARASGPDALNALLLSVPRSRAQAIELSAITKAVQTDSCRQFLCDQYDARANVTDSVPAASARATLVTPGPPAVATTPMVGAAEDAPVAAGAMAGGGHPLRRNKDRKRKKVVRDSSTTLPPPQS